MRKKIQLTTVVSESDDSKRSRWEGSKRRRKSFSFLMSNVLCQGGMLIALLLAQSHTYAADVVLENSGMLGYTSLGGHDLGQSFTATKTGVISSIGVVDDGGAVSGTATLNIYSGAGNGGALLYTKSGIDFNSVDTVTDANNYTFHTITIDSTVNITSGSVYTFILSPAVALDVAYMDANYAGGELYSYDAVGGSEPSFDMAFQVTQGDSVSPPTITSAAYNATNSTLVVTGVGFTANGGGSDVDVSDLTVLGQGSGTRALLTSSDVEIDSSTQFTVTLGGADIAAVEALLNRDGTQSADSVTYNLAAADDFITAVTAGDTSDAVGNGITVSNALDTDGALTSAAGVTEPVGLTWSTDTVGEAVDLFDFTLTDGGGADGKAMTVSQIVINVSGTASDTDRAKITWRLNGNDVSNVTGVYNAGANTITFSGLSISIADGGNEVYTINGYYNDNTGLTNDHTVILSVDGDTDLTVGSSGTQMGVTTAVNNGTGTVMTDNIDPVVTSVSVPANSTYATGANLDFTVNFNENVTVNTGSGTPRLTLTAGATTRYASYISGTGSSALVFRYTVVAGDQDLNGIAIAATLDPNLGTLRDSAGNNINTTLNSVGSLASVLIDGQAPTVAEVTPVTTPDNDSTPNVTFSTTEAGTLAVGGSCGSGGGATVSGNNTITLTQPDNVTPLASGTYSDCTATVTDSAGNTSNVLTLTSFLIDLADPTVDTNVGKSLSEGGTGIVISTTELSGSDDVSSATNTTYTIVSAPTNGILRKSGSALASGGTFTQADLVANAITYDHDGSETVSDTFTFTITDQSGNVNNNGAANFTFTFTVGAINDAPSTTADSDSTNEDSAVMLDVLANDSDADGSLVAASVTVSIAASNGMTAVNPGTGGITYTPNADFEGIDTFSYTVEDNIGLASAATLVTITVNAQNDAPVAVADIVTIPPSTPVTIDVAGNDTDVDTGDNPDPTTIVVVGAASNGSAVFNGVTNKVDYTPNGGFTGADTFTYTIDDGTGATSNVATVTVNVQLPLDTDGDNVSDVQEGIDGTDPNDPQDYLDAVAPVLTVPADIIVDATGLFTSVTQARLLAAPESSTPTELQALVTVTDNIDGAGCCNATVPALTGGKLLLPPGRNEVTWRATDNKGNSTTVTQFVHVRPLVSMNKDQVTVEGALATIRIILNGKAPTYPFQVPYVIDAASTANGSDHDLTNGTVTFNAGETVATISVNIASGDGAEGDEILTVALDDRTTASEDLAAGFGADIYDINSGASVQHNLTIVEDNVAPVVSLQVQQGGGNTIQITNAGGQVTVTATAEDLNVGDSVSLDWSASDNTLVDTDGDLADLTFVFDPSGLNEGRYAAVLTATDSQGAKDTATVNFVLVAALPTLSSGVDTDGDGTDDDIEGTADSDDDGIPDYLDNIAASNVLPESATQTNSFLIESDPGVRVRLGQFALAGASGGASLSEEDIDRQEGLTNDEEYDLTGGIFDFEIHELPVPGQQVRIVVPQNVAIPTNSVYRKFQNGAWTTFVDDDNNDIHSSAGDLGYCPPPGDDSWQTGLTAGHFCVQLTIEDGGPNDADGEVNSAILDPGSLGTLSVAPVAPTTTTPTATGVHSSGGGGGSAGLGLLGMLLLLGAVKNYRARNGLLSIVVVSGGLTLLLPSQESYAVDWQTVSSNSFVEFEVFAAEGSQKRSDFVSDMAGYGVDTNVTAYDVTRVGYQVSLGYTFNPYATLLVGYTDLGDVDLDFETSTTDQDLLRHALGQSHPQTGDGLSIAYRYSHSVMKDLSVFADAGLFIWSSDIDTQNTGGSPKADDGVDPMLALGIDYSILKNSSIGLKYRYHRLDDQNLNGLGLLFRVGF